MSDIISLIMFLPIIALIVLIFILTQPTEDEIRRKKAEQDFLLAIEEIEKRKK